MWKVRRRDNQPVCYNRRCICFIIYPAASPARRKIETRARLPVIVNEQHYHRFYYYATGNRKKNPSANRNFKAANIIDIPTRSKEKILLHAFVSTYIISLYVINFPLLLLPRGKKKKIQEARTLKVIHTRRGWTRVESAAIFRGGGCESYESRICLWKGSKTPEAPHTATVTQNPPTAASRQTCLAHKGSLEERRPFSGRGLRSSFYWCNAQE